MNYNSTFQELFNLSFWDTVDFSTLVFRYLMHLMSLLITVRFLYFDTSRRKDYLFTYFLISSVVFLLCYMLATVDLGIGMALSLFAIFGILRYRTGQIPIREMTYLFIVIGLAVVNSLANKEVSIFELLFVNIAILFTTWFIEKVWSINHVSRKIVQYDRIDLIKPTRHRELQTDIEERLGINIVRIEVGDVDFLRDTAKLVVYYKLIGKGNNVADEMDNFVRGSDE